VLVAVDQQAPNGSFTRVAHEGKVAALTLNAGA
jgi:hypothetical protein